MLAAADALDAAGKHAAAKYVRETADYWNEQIESWTYVSDTEMSRKLGISGYYMRIGYSEGDAIGRSRGLIPIRNRTGATASVEARSLISPDALALVRFGLRDANDQRILDTITAIDSLLKRDLPAGPYWYRYNDDGYGEHADGGPFDGTGVGRLWPTAHGRTGSLRNSRGKTWRSEAPFGNYGGIVPFGWAAAGADIGRGRYAGARTIFRAPIRKCDAPGVGSRRAH